MPLIELTSRWNSSPEHDSVSEQISNVFSHGGSLNLDHSPFGRIENDLLDFRGYSARQMRIRDVIIRDANFSLADFSASWMEAGRFENCLFEGTDFSDIADHGNTFYRCKFLKCNFSRAVLGYKGSKFNDCRFQECNFTRAGFVRAEFTDTDFTRCKLKGIDFNGSSFHNCKFEGLLEDVWFRGTFPHDALFEMFGQPRPNRMLNVSFENADLIDLTISDGCDLSTVKLKDNGKLLRYDDWFRRVQFLEKQLEAWDGELQKNEATRFVYVAKVHAQHQKWAIVNIDDLDRHFGGLEVARKIIDTLNSYATHRE